MHGEAATLRVALHRDIQEGEGDKSLVVTYHRTLIGECPEP